MNKSYPQAGASIHIRKHSVLSPEREPSVFRCLGRTSSSPSFLLLGEEDSSSSSLLFQSLRRLFPPLRRLYSSTAAWPSLPPPQNGRFSSPPPNLSPGSALFLTFLDLVFSKLDLSTSESSTTTRAPLPSFWDPPLHAATRNATVRQARAGACSARACE